MVERIGEWILAGCHCTYETRNGVTSWYDSFANVRHPVKLVGAVSVSSGRASGWSPDLAGSRDGVWAVHSDSLGCLLVGGQFDVAGVEAANAFWVGNWARFCPPGVQIPDRTSPTAPSGLAARRDGADAMLTWQAGTDNLAVAGYVVIRDGVEIATVSRLTYRDVNPGRGWHTYKIKTVDHAGNRSGNSNAASVQLRRR